MRENETTQQLDGGRRAEWEKALVKLVGGHSQRKGRDRKRALGEG